MTGPHQQIKDICLRLLSRREHSQKELQDKLAHRGFDRHAAQLVISELADQGWQNDRRYAESYVRQRIQKGYGPLRIAYELQHRGIDGIDLNALVDDLAFSWFDVMESVYLGKYQDDKRLLAKEWLKRSRFLQQRGFSGEMIRALYVQLDLKLER